MSIGPSDVTSRQISRASFLRGRFLANGDAIRPPYAIAEADFRLRCTRCGDCRAACETGVIGMDATGLPELLLDQSKCTFCGACATACTAGALNATEARRWAVTAHVRASCLSTNAIPCRSCEESCAAGAIRFQLMTGGRAIPIIDEAKCTGCGACAVICPNRSINLKSSKQEESVA